MIKRNLPITTRSRLRCTDEIGEYRSSCNVL